MGTEEGAPWEPVAQGLAHCLGLVPVGSLPAARLVLTLDWPATPTLHPNYRADSLTCLFQRTARAKVGRKLGLDSLW